MAGYGAVSAMIVPGERTNISMTLPKGVPFDEWAAIGEKLAAVERSIGWWLGDWWTYGEREIEGDRKKLVERLKIGGYRIPSFQTCMNAGSIARAFCETSRRREALSFTHHAEVAPLPPDEQDEILDRAESEKMSTRVVRVEVARRKNAVAIGAETPSDLTCTVADLRTLVARGAKYGTVYADPPWSYDNQGTRAATGKHYSGMTVDELCDLPVRELAADDAHLHLWTTNAFLFECPRIFAAWGFEFRSSFVWAKSEMGIGNYWRNSHEFLLTAIRGDAKRFADHSLKSWLECSRGKHSRKPEQARAFIERASPGPYLEMFGRLPVTNWSVWGNQIERNLLFPNIVEIAA